MVGFRREERLLNITSIAWVLKGCSLCMHFSYIKKGDFEMDPGLGLVSRLSENQLSSRSSVSCYLKTHISHRRFTAMGFTVMSLISVFFPKSRVGEQRIVF